MRREFRPSFTTVVVALLTIALGVVAWINFDQQRKFQPPDDGVTWKDTANGVIAEYVRPDGPAARAGVRAGDLALQINGIAVRQAVTVTHELWRAGHDLVVEYALRRQGVQFTASVLPEPQQRPLIWRYFQAIALLYLGMGIFVVLRRSRAPRALHFYLFCLASFVLLFLHYTGKLNPFDKTVYWLNVCATLLMPALLFHFALLFPDPRPWLKRPGTAVRLIYGSVAFLLFVRFLIFANILQVNASALAVLNWLDRVDYSYLAVVVLASGAVFYRTYREAETPLLRQQMKWITRGIALGFLPFALLYAVPYLFGPVTKPWLIAAATLPLVLVPLTFGYAIIRYRLMDVDILFRRGVAYTLATLILVAGFFTTIALVGSFFTSNWPMTGSTGLIVAMVISALLFQPLQNRIQDRLDRYFYRDRYDYRRTLIEFGRELSSQTDLDKMLETVIERLSATLRVDKVAVFLPGPNSRPVLAHSVGLSFAGQLELGFLDPERPEFSEGCLFFENTRQAPGESESARDAIEALDLHYYVPCRAQGRAVAFLGLGKTAENDYLSSEDVALIETLSGYIGTAVENAQLYARLKQKAAEYERLKDFNENIVESINMGILVLDLDDRIESWNTQLELMYGLSREEAYGQPIDRVFPSELVADLIRLRKNDGIHNLYKHLARTTAGEERVLNIAVAPLVTKRFELIGRLVIFDDITEQVRMEQQLVQAEKLSSIGLLAAGVAHEVNTPLAVISSYAQMLAKQMPAEDPRGKLLDKITKSTFRASEIVNNLLNFSRSGNAEMGAIDLNRVVTDTLGLLEHHFRTSHIQVETQLSLEAPMMTGNAGKLQQVFLNLFLNARDAMPQGGVLRVRSRVDGSNLLIEVSDTGDGIAREHLERIYDPFFTTKSARPGSATGQIRSGTGLGLSVTYGIIQEHSGKIRVESAPRQGTSFFLEFPRLRKAVTV